MYMFCLTWIIQLLFTDWLFLKYLVNILAGLDDFSYYIEFFICVRSTCWSYRSDNIEFTIYGVKKPWSIREVALDFQPQVFSIWSYGLRKSFVWLLKLKNYFRWKYSAAIFLAYYNLFISNVSFHEIVSLFGFIRWFSRCFELNEPN